MQFDDVRMLQLFQDLYLTVCALSISCMLEGIEYFFKRKDTFRWLFLDFPDMAISPRPHFFEDGKPFEQMALDISRIVLRHTLENDL